MDSFQFNAWQGRFDLHMLIKMTKYIWHTMVLCFWILSLQSVNLLASRKIKMKNYFVFMNFASLILIDYAWRCGFTTWHVWKNELGKPLWEDRRLMLYYIKSTVVIFHPLNHSLSHTLEKYKCSRLKVNRCCYRLNGYSFYLIRLLTLQVKCIAYNILTLPTNYSEKHSRKKLS